ncbi:MAG: hypothetical protein RQ758_00100 [Methanomicrobiaceae archaeon]|nr:hypothetical protein [Methanomicrobiaceae archaeon]
MKCPVCGQDCVEEAHEIVDLLAEVFRPCPGCMGRNLNKNQPPPDIAVVPICDCGKRYIDDVYVHLYSVMVEEGVLAPTDPLKTVGYPLVHPGFAMQEPPFLPRNSLVLLSPVVNEACARRLVDEVPEIRGVVKSADFVPGITDVDLDGIPETYELLAGCDVRANVFYTQNTPIVLYKQQSLMHIEFPRGYDPKIVSVGVQVRHHEPRVFVDAACGSGTLSLTAGLYGIPHVICNDAWYAAAFWTAYNLRVNRENLAFDGVKCFYEIEELKEHPIEKEPKKIAETIGGSQFFEVYQGDFHLLHKVLSKEVDLAVLDLFEKKDPKRMKREMEKWKEHVGGEVFIP